MTVTCQSKLLEQTEEHGIAKGHCAVHSKRKPKEDELPALWDELSAGPCSRLYQAAADWLFRGACGDTLSIGHS